MHGIGMGRSGGEQGALQGGSFVKLLFQIVIKVRHQVC